MSLLDKALAEVDESVNPATIRISSINGETAEEKKIRLLAELEELRQQEQLTALQQDEQKKRQELDAKKDALFHFFESQFGGLPNLPVQTSVHFDPTDIAKTIAQEVAKVMDEKFPKGLVQETTLVAQTSSVPEWKGSVSTPNALKSLAVTFAIGVAIFIGLMYMFGGEGSGSPSMENMFNAFPLRALINILLIGSALGISFAYVRFFHPEVWGYFHSKIKTQCSPNQDWNASPPQFRIQFVADLFWKWALLFILAFLVVFV